MGNRFHFVRCAIGLLLVVLTARSEARVADTVPGAKAFESRLYAPCCYNGTLDTHESELARELRKEIESRLDSRESLNSIHADLIARYGYKVIAARSDKPAQAVGVALLALMVLVATGLAFALRRWLRAGLVAKRPTEARSASDVCEEDPLDARIRAELAELDS